MVKMLWDGEEIPFAEVVRRLEAMEADEVQRFVKWNIKVSVEREVQRVKDA